MFRGEAAGDNDLTGGSPIKTERQRQVLRREHSLMVKWLMADVPGESPSEKLRMAFELIELADRMFRQRLRRESPGISEESIEEQVTAWYRRRPGAEFGDGEGTPAVWPRR